MAIPDALSVRQPAQNAVLPPLAGVQRATAIDESIPTPRPLVEVTAASPDTLPPTDAAAVILPFSQEARRKPSSRGSDPLRPSVSPDEPLRLVYNQRGAPSDAIPALTRLEARIALEPVFMQHYASTLYAMVSRMPATPSERRLAFDLFA
ncbi:MAG: hypothetical protein EBT35_08780 [Alphaproteobacteria bacterium]|nr:hypothetical protein [Alphaproteobacteria bacterium]